MTMFWYRVLWWVLDGHVLKDLMIRTQNVVRPGFHQPPLFRHRPQSLVSIPRSPLQEEVFGDVLKPHRSHHYCNLLVKSPPARSLQVHVEVSRKNQICPHWSLHHRRHHIPNRFVVKRYQVTVSPVDILRLFLPPRDGRHRRRFRRGVRQRRRGCRLGGGEAS